MCMEKNVSRKPEEWCSKFSADHYSTQYANISGKPSPSNTDNSKRTVDQAITEEHHTSARRKLVPSVGTLVEGVYHAVVSFFVLSLEVQELDICWSDAYPIH
ncbi:hypothetical protein TNIN_463921 [Trichonephila inaurata madagascariensis]|uniref:Uncharacterized protein n=1 Tax=Trichonephila inaurata madagascariensis TaxID=2747483 RepID=A0A8X6X998_9ARAC|nr:hypothetical protein TNIN_463921 [Trichonephila inaurata madagascariensis]